MLTKHKKYAYVLSGLVLGCSASSNLQARFSTWHNVHSWVDDTFKELETLSNHVGKSLTTLREMDVISEDDAYVIKLAAPGLSLDAFKIEVEPHSLTISVDVEQKEEEEEITYAYRGISHQSFVQRVSLEDRVELSADVIENSREYKDGILTLRLPKAEQTKNPDRIIIGG